MTPKRSRVLGRAVLLVILCVPQLVLPQQPPKKFSIVRNDSSATVTFEYKSGDEWKKVTLDASKDVNIEGSRVRIGTDRMDNATITVDLPIEGGKKYLVFWNDPPGMWDFKGTT
jgi:hypothetical protein